MDLFYSYLTSRGQLRKLKDEIGGNLYDEVPKGFKIVTGNIEHINNCALLIMEHVTKHKFMRAPWDRKLVQLCTEYGINNKFITYSYLKDTESVSRSDITSSRKYIQLLLSIIQPKLIVVIGENTLLSFLSKKQLLVNFHGKIVGKYEEVPLILTYPMGYYLQYGRQDEKEYRESILLHDWTIIQEEYNKRISNGI
jgi:hypothetical protein